MIFRIDEDRVVRASGHAGLATDADRFVEIDDAVRPLEHRGRWAGGHAGRVCALIAARDLMCASHLRKHADIDVLDISARHTNRHKVFRLARRCARMAADAAGVVDYLGPLDSICPSWFLLDNVHSRDAKYTMKAKHGLGNYSLANNGKAEPFRTSGGRAANASAKDETSMSCRWRECHRDVNDCHSVARNKVRA